MNHITDFLINIWTLLPMFTTLGHINLSVEMLQSIIEDNDLKMYLDVIMRNSIRIDNLIQELLESHLTDARQAEKISNHILAY